MEGLRRELQVRGADLVGFADLREHIGPMQPGEATALAEWLRQYP